MSHTWAQLCMSMKSTRWWWKVELYSRETYKCYHRIGDTVSRTIYSIPLLIPVFSSLFWTHLHPSWTTFPTRQKLSSDQSLAL